MERLHKIIANAGYCSRRKAEKLIESGNVYVNGERILKKGKKVNPQKDVILINGKPLRKRQKGIILVNKPTRVVSTLYDPEGRRCLKDLVSKRYRDYVPAGRLDFDASGLIIMSNDGEVIHRLTHPRFLIPRVYKVLVSGYPSESSLRKLEKGLTIDGRKVRVKVKFIGESTCDRSSTWLELKLWEGRNHIVKRLCSKIGHPVISLIRIKHGPFSLSQIGRGRLKRLSEKDYLDIRRRLGLESQIHKIR